MIHPEFGPEPDKPNNNKRKMSWIAERFSPMRYSPMEKPPRTATTLADLLGRVVDDDDGGDADVAPPHHAISLGGARHRRFVLSFVNLTYTVKCKSDVSRTKTKTLLSSITGEAREGEILAVMGASGSGKSTLIDALANRISKRSLKGSVTLNGEDVEEKIFKSISAYVMQDDLLYPMLTVEETLMFSAEFRLPRTLTRSKKKARVEALIDQLGLRFAARTIIGDEGHRGVSGGERRRVSIGTDIIHDPIVLFLDEPTSGLDSTSAFMVVKVLQRIAHGGSVVIMSVHQPSSRLLGLLDRILFLSRGQTVYNGSPGGLSMYLAEFGRPIPENENRVEFALDLIRELESSDGGGGIGLLVQFYKSWQNLKCSSSGFDVGMSLKDAIATSISRGKLVSGSATFANPPWVEMLVLAKRSITNSRRMPEFFAMRLGAMLVTGFVLATVFWKLDDTPKGITERLGVLAFAMSTIYYSSVEALPVFLQERYIFMRETAYNAYRRSSYVLSNAVVELPSHVSLALAFSATTFFAIGLAGGPSGFLFFFLTILTSFWAGSSFVTFLSGVIPHLMIGYTVSVAVLAYFLLFCGFFINRGRIPGYWIWFHYLSLEKYPFQAFAHNEFDGNKCFTKGAQIFDNTIMESLSEATKAKALSAIGGVLGVPLTNQTCVTTGLDVLRQQGINELGKWNCLLVTLAWGFFFRVLFYFALLLGSKNKRR